VVQKGLKLDTKSKNVLKYDLYVNFEASDSIRATKIGNSACLLHIYKVPEQNL